MTTCKACTKTRNGETKPPKQDEITEMTQNEVKYEKNLAICAIHLHRTEVILRIGDSFRWLSLIRVVTTTQEAEKNVLLSSRRR